MEQREDVEFTVRLPTGVTFRRVARWQDDGWYLTEAVTQDARVLEVECPRHGRILTGEWGET